MSKLINITVSIVGILAMSGLSGYAQGIPRLCICFDADTEFINVNMREDSPFTSFSIPRKGYETEEQRQQAWDEYYQGPPTEDRYPVFSINFVATTKPGKVTFIKEIDDCVALVTVEEYRQEDFRRPARTRSDLFIFIKKLADGTFLKWEAMVMPEG